MSQKQCSRCKDNKDFDEFYTNRGKPASMCKVCTKANNVEYRKDPIIKEREQKRVKENMRKKYGIKNMSYKRYEEILKQQNHSCKICGKHESKTKRKLAVDHDHETGEVRGLFCDRCNYHVGIVSNKLDITIKCIDYLQK